MTASARARAEAGSRWPDFALILAVAATMLAWSWGKWPDVQVDFGQQLYVAWQLSEGQVLHRDLAWHHGALPPYLNAFWFLVFGVSLRALVLCNLVLLALLAFLLDRLLLEVAGRWAATAGTLTLVVVFAFGQQTFYGNYNFVTPYEHGVLHGILLSLVALLALWRYAAGGSSRWLVATGLASGLVFLTKAEVFLALLAAVGVGCVSLLVLERAGRRRAFRLLGTVVLAGLAPPGLVFGLFCLALPAPESLLATLGPWPAVFTSDPLQSTFHQRGLGTLDPAASAKSILGWLAGYLLVFGAALGAAFGLRARRTGLLVLALSLFGLLALELATRPILWSSAVRPLPLFLLAAAAASLISLWADPAEPRLRATRLLTLIWLVFALGLLAKMVLNVRTHHYGFALAMPASLALVATLVGWIPDWISGRGGRGGLFRAVALAMLAVAALGHLRTTARYFERKVHRVADGGDALWADSRGRHVDRLLDEIAARVAPDATLAVLPDGTMINYLSRRSNSIPYVFFAPVNLRTYGDETILESFRSNPPDYVVLVHKDASEFGHRFFGDGYGESLMEWIRGHYRQAALFGHPPLESRRWGVVLLERSRRDAETAG